MRSCSQYRRFASPLHGTPRIPQSAERERPEPAEVLAFAHRRPPWDQGPGPQPYSYRIFMAGSPKRIQVLPTSGSATSRPRTSSVSRSTRRVEAPSRFTVLQIRHASWPQHTLATIGRSRRQPRCRSNRRVCDLLHLGCKHDANDGRVDFAGFSAKCGGAVQSRRQKSPGRRPKFYLWARERQARTREGSGPCVWRPGLQPRRTRRA